jgi:ABC-type lipoprotein export system ATPase subunit
MGQIAVDEISILPGRNKQKEVENFDRIDIHPGDTISIVGPTGSGKSAFINDIEVFAQGDTNTGRKILVNGEIPPDEMVRNPAKKPIALISQNTRCIADLKILEFLTLHIQARGINNPQLIQKTMDVANEFTGEKIHLDCRMAALSGGQTRSLFIADAIVIGGTPILLLDEIENAGIFKEKVISILKEFQKSVILVTHDPYLALCSERRIIMKNGAVDEVILASGKETELIGELSRIDMFLSDIRERLRIGETFPNGYLPIQKSGVQV